MIHNISISSRILSGRNGTKQYSVRCPCGFYAFRVKTGEEAMALGLVHHAHHPGGSVQTTYGNGK